MRCQVVLVSVVVALVAAACSGDPGGTTTEATDSGAVATTTTTSAPTSTTEASTTTTESAADGVGALTEFVNGRAELTVPLDHDDPGGPTIAVPVWLRPADDPDARIGVLLVNPGGPGVAANGLVRAADNIYAERLLEVFDIVAIDPRGTSPSTAVDCGNGIDEYLGAVDWSPEDQGELDELDRHIQGQVDRCVGADPDLIDHVSTMDTVHDHAVLIEALGEETATWFGFSYGTTLGAALVTEYPELIRAAVFDGASQHVGYGDPVAELLADAEADEALLVRILEGCDASEDCPIDGPAIDAFGRVAAAADEAPFDDDPALVAVNQQLFSWVLAAGPHAYGGPTAPLLTAVAAADDGDGSLLQQYVADAADFQQLFSGFLQIVCLDYPYRGETPYPDDIDDLVDEVAPTRASVFPTPEFLEDVQLPGECERWPVGPELLPSPLSGEGGGPVLLVTATGDPVTPKGSADALAEELVNETVLVVEDDQHVSYNKFGNEAQRCATGVINDFLVDLEVPPEGFVCGP